MVFQVGSSRFPRDVSQSMTNVISYLRTKPDSKVSLAGFHDATGNPESNRLLANRRSNSVRQVLIESGISSDRINIEKPSQTLGTGAPQEARRVEVKIV